MASTSASNSELKEENAADKILKTENVNKDEKSRHLSTIKAENEDIKNTKYPFHVKVGRTSHHVPWKQFTEITYFKRIYDFMSKLRRKKILETRKRLHMKYKCKSDCECQEKLKKFHEVRESKELKDKLSDLTSQQMGYIDKIAENMGKKFHGGRFTIPEKLMCLSIYKSSELTYDYLRNLMVLPDKAAINKFKKAILFNTGITIAHFIRLVEVSNSLKDIDKVVVLMFARIDLKINVSYSSQLDKIIGFEDWGQDSEWNCFDDLTALLEQQIANSALVFAIRGIHSDWFLPVAHIFCGKKPKVSKLVDLIKEIVVSITVAEFKIVASVCDQKPYFEDALEKLRAETYRKRGPDTAENAGTILIHDCEFVPLFCPVDLLVDFRNNFFSSDLEFSIDSKSQPLNWDHDRELKITKSEKKLTASWSHVQLAYRKNVDCKPSNQVPSLLQKYTQRKKVEKEELDFILNVFNGQLSAFLDKYSCENADSQDKVKIPPEGYFTSFILSFIEKLFQALNVEKKNDPMYELRTVLTDDSFHHEFFETTTELLRHMRFVDKQSHKPVDKIHCIKNLMTTVQGFQVLWKKLKELDFQFVKMRNFSLEPLDVFSEKNTNLTCTQFSRDFKNFCYPDITV